MYWRVPLGVALVSHSLAFEAAGQIPPQATEEAPAEPNATQAAPKPAPPTQEPAPKRESENVESDPTGAVQPQPLDIAPDATAEPTPGEPGPAEPAPAEPPPPASSQPELYEEPEIPMTPSAPDSVSGHFVVAAAGGYAFPYGRLASDVSQRHQLGPGWMLGADIGIGVARSAVVGVSGQFARLSDGSRCSGCTGTTFAVGPQVRYHLVQGLRLDPWLSFSVAYRSLTIDDDGSESSYAGVDWANVRVGGDWYPGKNVGLGPFLEAVSGGYFERPDNVGGLRTYWQLSIGARLVLDVPGKLK